ncbi:hypothetical protein [Rufibacter psychrotolerans]|uniref:hypothetical protein n=1 Tax=Rufibacter psychrotolerans TaxID=2812556 RepID=UPI001967F173|nr:hypothetical protein [Rufibacter sp. SYSU D00308]
MGAIISAEDVKRLLLRVYTRYQGGGISEAQAQKETFILNSLLKAIEVADLEERLKAIEQSMKDHD